jgi:hypothetical protein
MAVTAAVAAVTTTVVSIDQSRKAAKAQERAAEQQQAAFRADQRKAEVQNVRNVRQQIRAARMAQSSMTNVAAQTGGMGGSGIAGGTASVGSQMASSLGFMADIARENTAISNAQIASAGFQGQAARASSNAAIFGQIGQLSGTIFADQGGTAAAKKQLGMS